MVHEGELIRIDLVFEKEGRLGSNYNNIRSWTTMDDYMATLNGTMEKSFGDLFGSLENDFDRLYVSNAARFLEKSR
jgi:hypothetical protein